MSAQRRWARGRADVDRQVRRHAHEQHLLRHRSRSRRGPRSRILRVALKTAERSGAPGFAGLASCRCRPLGVSTRAVGRTVTRKAAWGMPPKNHHQNARDANLGLQPHNPCRSACHTFARRANRFRAPPVGHVSGTPPGRFSRAPQDTENFRRRAFTRLRTNPCSHTSAKNPRVEEFAGPIKSNSGPGTPGRRPLAR